MNLRTWITLAAVALAAPASTLAQSHDHAAHAKKTVKTVDIAVTSEGFTPATVKAKAGETLRLVVTRKTKVTCATDIVIKDFGVNQPLPLDKPVTVEITPKKPGDVRFACGMDMIAGTITVE